MKKLFAFLLVVCMLLTSCIAFSSCSKVSKKDAEKDPQAVLSEAIDNSYSEFFEDDLGLNEIVAKALENGSMSISVEAETLKSQIGLGKITETLYMNQEDGRVVSDTVVNFQNQDLSARIFLDKNSLMVNGESVLGSNSTYALYPATLAEKLFTSEIAAMLGLTEQSIPEDAKMMLDSLKSSWDAMFTQLTDAKKAAENANAMLSVLQQTVSTEKYKNAEGKNVNCVKIAYIINNETLQAFFNKALEVGAVDNAELKSTIDETFASMKYTALLDLKLHVFINQKTNQVESISLGGAIKNPEDQSTLSNIYIGVTFSADELVLTARQLVGAEKEEITVTLNKEKADDATTYKLSVKEYVKGGTTADLANATYTLKKSGDFTLNFTAGDDEDKTEFTVTGKLTVNKKDATITITSVKSGDVTVEIDASITFKAEAEIPVAPTDAKDVMDLTEADIEKIMTDFQNSKLGKLISGMME